MQATMLKVAPLENCERCGAGAKVLLPYGPHRFCAEHFTYFFEHRVKKTIRMNRLIDYGEKIAVGVSGGKDSMATLHLLNNFFGKTGQNKIEAIMIDEGIKGYRDKALEIGKNYCKENGITCHTMNFREEFGIETEKVMQRIHSDSSLGSSCSYCGVFRRKLLNKKAIEIGADKLATGHNLDDECQSIAMSLFGNDFARLSRLGESTGGKKEGMVPRIKPLYDTPEKEVIAYTALNGIEHYSEECCPYSWMAKRNTYRKTLNELEENFPGTKFGIISAFRKMKPLLIQAEKQGAKKFGECASCGEPANAELCGACRQMQRLTGEAAQKTESRKMKTEKGPSCAVTKGTANV